MFRLWANYTMWYLHVSAQYYPENNSRRRWSLATDVRVVFAGLMVGCFAAKLPGQISASIMTDSLLEYLITNLNAQETHPQVTLFALIALEKLAQTGENKRRIIAKFEDFDEAQHPLVLLEKINAPENYVKRQIQFCAAWSLDNIFLIRNRKFTYESIDSSNVNSMLSQTDASEYLKLAADGFSARNDCNSFESVRCTFQVEAGVWYYEATVSRASWWVHSSRRWSFRGRSSSCFLENLHQGFPFNIFLFTIFW